MKNLRENHMGFFLLPIRTLKKKARKITAVQHIKQNGYFRFMTSRAACAPRLLITITSTDTTFDKGTSLL